MGHFQSRLGLPKWLAGPLAGAALLAAATSAAAMPPPSFPAWTPLPGGQAEGVAVDRTGHVYVSVREGDNGVILRFDRHGEADRLAEIGPGMIGGLAFSAEGDLYAAVAAGAARGVYRIFANGDTELVPGTDQIVFANALAFDQRGSLYITESHSLMEDGSHGPGGIWRVTRHGEARPWLRHALLTGVGAVLGYPVGANGIGFFRGDLYVVNTDKSIVVRVPITRRGRPGTPDVWAQLREVDSSPLAGHPVPPMGDGLALDADGNAYVALVTRCSVVRLDANTREQEMVAFFQFGPDTLPRFAPLDTPASLAFGPGPRRGHGHREDGPSLFVTNLGWMAGMAPGPPWPGPGLVRIDVERTSGPVR